MQHLEKTTDELVELLSRHRTIGKAPREELIWVATHGTLRHHPAGEIVARPTDIVDGLYILLSGRIVHLSNKGTGIRKIMEWTAGEVTGVLPYSRLTTPPGESIVEEPADVVHLERDTLPDLIRNCYHITSTLVHVMTDRARQFTSADLRDEKLISLGKLASGLAHELNNPASAIIRDAKALAEAIDLTEAAARDLLAVGLATQQLNELDAIRNSLQTSRDQPLVSGLELSDNEETIAAWLYAHKVEGVPADELARAAISPDVLERLASVVKGNSFDAALRWVAGSAVTHALAYNIDRAAERMYSLVTSVKGFTHMDHLPVTEPVDIPKGLGDTITILGGKARKKGVTITLDVSPNLPKPHGVGVEINQIWMNLIDNAIDAAPTGGHVTIAAERKGDYLFVRVLDNGPGIAADILSNIFDPFFTTKPVGEGTGLGLDIVRRIVRSHNGEVEVNSKPGQTEFRVKIPLEER